MEEESLEVPPVKERKIDPVGKQIYGEKFTGFQKVAEFRDLIPAFKELYYEMRIKDPKVTLTAICHRYNEIVFEKHGRYFYPSMSHMRQMRKVWDADMLAKRGLSEYEEDKKVKGIVKMRKENGDFSVPGDGDLEDGVRTLGGELLNDAMQMLRDDREDEDIISGDALIKRRNYIVNVFSHATKLVHGKAALMLKASEEKRNTAGFLMTLLARATSGKMTEEEMALLESSYASAEIPDGQEIQS